MTVSILLERIWQVLQCDYRYSWMMCHLRTQFHCKSLEKIKETLAQEQQVSLDFEEKLRANGTQFSFSDCPKYRRILAELQTKEIPD